MNIPEGELRSLEYNPDRETQELRETVAAGMKYKAALPVFEEVFDEQRDNIIRQLETSDFSKDSDAIGLVLYLRVLKMCRNIIETKITAGEAAENELREKEQEENGE